MPGAEPSGSRLRTGGHVAGDRVGRYEIVSQIGRGAMGVVYEAEDPDLDRRVALKVIRFPTLAEDGTSEREVRLRREAQALAQLSHPNVVTVLDVGRDAGELFIAMELIRGVTLKAWLADGPHPWTEIVEVFTAAGRGLAAAHAVDLVHRDFKPDNVMVGEDGRVRVLDFGVARLGDPAASMQAPISVGWDPSESNLSAGSVTRAGMAPGTPAYMSPEQHRMLDVDARSDQFSFCAALYEGLYGVRAFAGETPVALSASICGDPPRPPPPERGVPAWLFAVLRRGLAKEPSARFSSMDELLAALRPGRRWRRGLVVLGIVVAGGAAATWAIAEQRARSSEQACLEAGASIRAEYSPEDVEAIRDGLAAVESGYGPTAARLVGEGLRGYVDAWDRVRVDVCRRTEVEQAWDADTGARAVECLEERREGLAALVELLREPDRDLTFRAAGAVAELDEPEPCADETVLARRPAAVADPEVRKRLVAARHQLRRCDVLRSAGHYAQARELVQSVLDVANAEGAVHLALDAEMELGQLMLASDDHDAARTHLERAYFEAEQHGLDDVMAEAAVLLVSVVGRFIEDVDGGMQWARHAEGAIERMQPPEELRRAELLTARAHLYVARHDFDAALRDHEEALEIRLRRLGDGHSAVAVSLSGIGSVYYGRGEAARTAEYVTRVLEIRKRSLGAEHPLTAGTHHNLGMVYTALGRYDEAETELRAALRIRERVFDDNSSVANTVEALADLASARGDQRGACDLYARALAVQEQSVGPDHPAVARVLNNYGTALRRAGRDGEALQALQRSLRIAEVSIGPTHPNTLTVMWAIGRQHAKMGDHDAARETLDRVRELRRSTDADPKIVARDLAEYVQLLWDGPQADRATLRRLAAEAILALQQHVPSSDAWRGEFETWWTAHESDPDDPPPSDSAAP